MAQVVACVGLLGCGFSARDPGATNGNGPPDAPPASTGSPDASTGSGGGSGSGSDGGATATGCLAMWMDGSVRFNPPKALDKQSSKKDSERDPWVSPDGLRLYYAFSRDNENTDIYLATRPDNKPTTPFGDGQSQSNLNRDTTNDGRPALTPDEKTLVMSSDRDTEGNDQFNILIVTRTDITQMFATPDDTKTMANVNASNVDHFDPFISADGLHLYFAPSSNGQHIAVASRGDTTSAFSNVQMLGINLTGALDADPAVSNDDKILVFSSNRAIGSGTDLWYATRTDVNGSFGNPKPIPDVNSPSNDGDPMITADGCTLYFSSGRGPGNSSFDLYSATVTTK